MRNILRIALRSMRSKGYNQKHLLLVGYSRAAEGFIDRVNVNPEWGYKIRGILDDHEEWGKEYKGVRVIGKIDDLDTILALNTLDEIAITLSIQEYGKLEKSWQAVKNRVCIRNLSRIIITLSRPVRLWRICRDFR